MSFWPQSWLSASAIPESNLLTLHRILSSLIFNFILILQCFVLGLVCHCFVFPQIKNVSSTTLSHPWSDSCWAKKCLLSLLDYTWWNLRHLAITNQNKISIKIKKIIKPPHHTHTKIISCPNISMQLKVMAAWLPMSQSRCLTKHLITGDWIPEIYRCICVLPSQVQASVHFPMNSGTSYFSMLSQYLHSVSVHLEALSYWLPGDSSF